MYRGTNISPPEAVLKIIFLFLRWDMLVPWRLCFVSKKLGHCFDVRLSVLDMKKGPIFVWLEIQQPAKSQRDQNF